MSVFAPTSQVGTPSTLAEISLRSSIASTFLPLSDSLLIIYLSNVVLPIPGGDTIKVFSNRLTIASIRLSQKSTS